MVSRLQRFLKGRRWFRTGWDPTLSSLTVVLTNGASVSYRSPLNFTSSMKLETDPTLHEAWIGEQDYDFRKGKVFQSFLNRHKISGMEQFSAEGNILKQSQADKDLASTSKVPKNYQIKLHDKKKKKK